MFFLYILFFKNINYIFFKKINYIFFQKIQLSNNFLFRIHKNISHKYMWFFFKNFFKKKLFFQSKNKRFYIKCLRFFIKPTYMVYLARLSLRMLFFLKKPQFVLTRIINLFFNWSGDQILFFFYKNLFFFYKNLFFFYKNLFFFYKSYPMLINNKLCTNMWISLKYGDLVKFYTNPYILLFFFKKIFFFKKKKTYNLLYYQLIKHFFNRAKTPKTQFRFFWKKQIITGSQLWSIYLVDYKAGLAVMHNQRPNIIKYNNWWANWYSYNIYNWKYII